MTEIVFINPPTPSPPEHADYGIMAPPMGIGYLASMLRREEYEVDAIDLALAEDPVADMRAFLQASAPKIIGFYTLTQNYYVTEGLLKIAREEFPECLFWVGGPHVSYEYRHALEVSGFDVVFLFEAEYTVLDVAAAQLRNNGKLDGIAGIAYRNHDGQVIKAPPRPREKALDEIPYPARDLFPIHRYTRPGSIMSSRGCPLKCIFCIASTFEDAYRYRSSDNVFGELKHMYETWGIDDFYFVDNVFTTHRARAREIARLIQESGLPVGWYCVSRVDYVSPELMQDLAAGGCYRVELGVESADLDVIGTMKKHIKIEQVMRACDIILNLGMQPMFTFQVGHPDDTLQSIQATLNLIEDLRSMGAGTYLSITTPYPGTPLYLDLEKYGVTLETQDWEDFRWSNPTYSSAAFSPNDLRKAIYFEANRLSAAVREGRITDPPSAPWKRLVPGAKPYKLPPPSTHRDPGTLNIAERRPEAPSKKISLPVLQIKRDFEPRDSLGE